MAEFEYGPVDLYVIGFEGDRLDVATFEAIAELVEAGDVRVLDAIIVSRLEDGSIEVREFEDLGDEFDVTDVTFEASGLVGDEDIDELGAVIPPGTSGAVLAIELLWAKKLASRFAQSGGVVLQTERIPAHIVNTVLAAGEDGEE